MPKNHKTQAFLLTLLCFLPLVFAFYNNTKLVKPKNSHSISIAHFISQNKISNEGDFKRHKPKETQHKERQERHEYKPKPERKPQNTKNLKNADKKPSNLKKAISTKTDSNTSKANTLDLKTTNTDSNMAEFFLKGNNENSFLQAVKTAIERNLTYPKVARKMRLEGTVLVEFLWMKNKELKIIRIKKSSGYKVLDESAIATIQRAKIHFPAYKQDAKIQIPIVYKLEN